MIAAGARDRAHRAHRGRRRRRSGVPREPLLVRRPDRVHGCAARGHPAAHARARARAAVRRAPERDGSRASVPARRARRRAADVRDLGALDADPPRRALRRPGLARRRPRRLRRGAEDAAGGACSSTSLRSRSFPPAPEFERILVPMKLGDIGEEMVATAIALAKERGAAIEAITVVRVPRKFALEGRAAALTSPRGSTRRSTRRGRSAPITASRCAATSFARARSATRSSTRPSAGTPISSSSARRRAGGGSRGSSRRRSTSCFGNAPCEVLVVAFPDGVFEE